MEATTSPDPKSPDGTIGAKWDGKRRARNDAAPELFKPGPVEEQGNGIYEEEPTATRRIKSVSDLASIFGWSQREIGSLPSRAERGLDASLYSDSQRWKLMVQYTMSALFCSAEVMYPANCPALLEAVAEKVLKKNHTTYDELNRLVDALVTIANESPSQSIQMRVARAALIKGLSKFEIERLRAENKFKFSGSTRTRAYKDFSLMESGASLEKPVQRQKRFEEASAEKLVQFLLAPENLGTITRCSKRIAVGVDEFMEFPLLVRHKNPSELYDAYVAKIAEDDRISRSSFHETVSMVTVRDLTPSGQSQGPADDTTLGILVHDTIAMLQAIIKDCSETLHERATLESSLGLLTHFLTKEFDAHVRLGDDVPYHMSSFCLNEDFGATQFQGICGQCHFIPYFFGRLRKLKVLQDSSRVITTCEHRIQLYQASRIRLANQKEAIQKVFDAMESYSTSNQMDSTHALISMSWKAPFIASRSALSSANKVKQSEPSGSERQVPWSCCVLSYYRYEKKDSRADQVNLYFDSLIASPHSRLGPELVAGVVEAILAQVHEKLPHLESVTLSLGTEECFASESTIVLFQLLNTKVWPKIEKVVYSEAPDRDELISKHYKRAQLHIDHFQRYSKPGVALRQICSAKGLARALAWGDGLQNAVVQLLRLDNSKLNEIMSMVDPLAKAMRNATRPAKCNIIGEVLLRQAEGMVAEKQLLSASDIDSCTGLLKMTVFRYSGIGEGKQVVIDMLLTAAAATTKDVMNLAFDTDPQVATDAEIINSAHEEDFHEVPISLESVGVCEPVPQDDFDFGQPCVEAPPLVFFGPSPYVAASMLSGVSVVLYSKFRELRAYRTRTETAAPKPTERKDLLMAVARKIKERIEKECTPMEINVLFEKALAVPLSPEVLVPGWAVQQSVSPFDIVGFSADYKAEIENVFEQRPGLCASEVGPSQVRTALSRRFQDRYGIPGENEIKHEISKLVLQRGGLPDAMPSFTHHLPADHLNTGITQATPSRNMLAHLEEQAHSSSSSNFRVKRGRKSPLTSVQNEYLMQLLDEHPDLKPQKALESFIAKFPEAKVHEKAVKSKISNAKAKRRRLVA